MDMSVRKRFAFFKTGILYLLTKQQLLYQEWFQQLLCNFFIMLHDTKEHLLESFQNNALMIVLFIRSNGFEKVITFYDFKLLRLQC